jgi:hypothetical protein
MTGIHPKQDGGKQQCPRKIHAVILWIAFAAKLTPEAVPNKEKYLHPPNSKTCRLLCLLCFIFDARPMDQTDLIRNCPTFRITHWMHNFGEKRIQPYVLSGISILSAKQHTSMSTVHNNYVELSDREWSSTGIGPALGAGLRASPRRHFSIRPEVRFSDGTALSSLNLSQWRVSVVVAYGW